MKNHIILAMSTLPKDLNVSIFTYNDHGKYVIEEKEEKDYMGSIVALCMYLMLIGFIAVVAYFVIKKAIKDALKEYHNENNK